MTKVSPLSQLKDLAKLWPWLRRSKHLIIISAVMIPIAAMLETAAPLIVQRTIDQGVMPKDMDAVLKWGGLYLGVVILSYLFRVVQSVTTATAVHKMILEIRESLVRHVLRLPSTFHDKQLSGSLATRATGDFDNLSESLNQGVLSSVIDVVSLAGCVVGMFILSPKLALITIVLVPAVTWVVLWFSKKLNHSMMEARKKIAALNGFTQEAFSAMSAVKLLNATKQVTSRYRTLNRSHRDAQMQSVFYDAFMFATLDGISSITLGIVLFVVIQSYDIGTTLSAGVIVGFVQYVQQIFEPLKQLGTKMAMLQGAFTSIDRIFGLLDRKEHIPGDKPVHWQTAPQVLFEHVSFSYGTESGGVLYDVSFEIKPETSLALVGATGSGKSTIVKLLCKMYAGHQGKILLGGEDINSLDPEDVRRRMAIVPQDIVLFDGSIAFNIGLGAPDVTLDDIKAAAAITGADRFIRSLDGTYDFPVREGATNLSHGQRQLIAFTRALVRRPSIIVLDEATSSIDPQSEALVQESLARILKGRTVIVIAHRLNTIERCDQVIVLERGRVVETGGVSELMAIKGFFYRLKHAEAVET